MIVPIVGELLAQISLILNYYFKHWPMEVAGISEVIFPGLSGGWFLLFSKICKSHKNKFQGVFSYIADVTSEEERTLRIGIVNIFFSISIPVGMGFSGILLK
jgi:MFS transporter, PCFT/HCP family, solute carrier family 46, member 3